MRETESRDSEAVSCLGNDIFEVIGQRIAPRFTGPEKAPQVYNDAFIGIPSIEDQQEWLRARFPKIRLGPITRSTRFQGVLTDELCQAWLRRLGMTDEKELPDTITNCFIDGVLILPKLSFLARHFHIPKPYDDGYSGVVKKVCRDFLGPKLKIEKINKPWINLYLRDPVWMTHLERKFSGDTIVWPVNLGSVFRNFSGETMWELAQNDYKVIPLCPAHGAMLLAMIPGRIAEGDILGCAGGVYEGSGLMCPVFEIRFGQLTLTAVNKGTQDRCDQLVAFELST